MHGEKKQSEEFVLSDVLNRPRKGGERHSCMQPDPQQHRERAQGIQIVSALCGRLSHWLETL